MDKRSVLRVDQAAMRRARARALIILCIALGVIAPALSRSEADGSGQISRTSRAPAAQSGDQMNQGLQFRLSEGREQPEKTSSAPPAQAAPLSEADTETVLNRLKPIKTDPADQQEFAFRDRSLPPPLTGKLIKDAFPPPDQPGTPDTGAAGPLEVLRYAPEGEVPLAPHLSVTFSQPMVAVTSVEDLAAANVPVRLKPQPAGKWRWIGTKTLLFVPDGRFPMATDYSVEVPAGVKSALGASLGTAKKWSFDTPPPQMKSSYPGSYGPQRRDVLMFAGFDQQIDPAAVLAHVRVRAAGADLKIRLAEPKEVAADKTISQLAKNAGDGRWLAFRAVARAGADANVPLPGASQVTVSIGAGTPSAEGPRTTPASQDFSFSTYGPLQVIKHECGYEGCHPFDAWSIQFSNPLDMQSFDKSQVRVEPELPGMKASVYGNTLVIQGASRGRTTYKVTLDPAIRDQFDQTLGSTPPLSFTVGSAYAAISTGKDGLIVLDPYGPPRFSVYSINFSSVKASLYAVGPEDWSQFAAYMQSSDDDSRAPRTAPPGRLAFSKTIPIEVQQDELTETKIDLSPALQGGHGQTVLVIEPGTATGPVPRWYRRQRIRLWIEATDIGLDAFVDNTDLVGWATSLKDGRPIEGVQLTVMPQQTAAQTGPDGLARIALAASSGKGPGLLVARKGTDIAMLPENTYWWGQQQTGWHRTEPKDSLRWYVFDDRGMYKPGEEVHFKGWIRRVGAGKTGDVEAFNGAVKDVTYTVKDSRNNQVGNGTLSIDALGGFDASFKLPDAMNLGYASIQVESQAAAAFEGYNFNHQFQVQEFRWPEFEVSTSSSDGPHFVGGHADVTVKAAYYAGGGLPNADVNWRVTSTPGYFTPPNRGDFTFGEWIPWWRPHNDSTSHTENYVGHTDAAGKHDLRIDFDSANPPRPYSVNAQASVTDVNRQAWTATANLLVHPSELYVGLRSNRTFVQKGEPLVVQSIVTDLDGKAIAGRSVKMRAVLMDWVYEKGEWRQQEANPQECTVTSQANPVSCTFQTKEGGMYRVTATVMDDRERQNQSALTLWVAGGKAPPKRDVELEEASLIPDHKDYKPGDTAEILVQSPFFPADGVLTIRRSGLISTEHFHLDSASTTLKIPVKENYIPNFYVQVELSGAASRGEEGVSLTAKTKALPKRPAFASGSLNLSVPPVTRKLTLTATPHDPKTEPGAETTVDVQVKDATGEPVQGSQVAVVVVDEAILALTNYKLDDPVSVFYSSRSPDTMDYRSRTEVLLANPEDLADKMGGGVMQGVPGRAVGAAAPPPKPAPMMAMRMAKEADAAFFPGQANQGPPGIGVRENFNALATFAAALPTDSNGRVSVRIKLPDNLTRYRVEAVAVAGGKQFGSTESAITARLPLMVRPSPPRFLNYGDKFELPIVVQNQTDSPMDVEVAVRTANVQLTEGSGRKVTVPANDRVEVRFPAAAVKAGTARFQIAAASGRWADAAEVELPVWTPATTEAFATYGEIDNGAITQPVAAPGEVVKQFGGLEISTSSTELQALTDAVLYLEAYPFECSEQLSSRVLAVAALKDVLAAFDAKGLPKPEEMVAAVQRDIKRLQSMQNDDGGFGFWKRGDQEWPYLGIHVAHALERAREKNFDVPPVMLDRSHKYLRSIEQHIPDYYGPPVRRAIVSYALYVRNLMGDRDAAAARAIIREAGLDGLSLESVGWLLPVLSGDAASSAEVAAIRKLLNNRVEETAGLAHFTTSYSDGAHLLLHSDRRADGVILDALIGDQPNSDLIPKLVRGLLAHRVEGRWGNTQENCFILLALDRYFATYEKTTPNFTARAWLGQGYAGGFEFKGRTTDRHLLAVPMRYLVDSGGTQNLVLSKEGPGRLYYRIGMQYAPASLKLAAADYGFAVERVYEAVDKADDVRRDSDGTWHIKAGATVRVRLTMVAPARRYHVALVDPIPAGLEAMNPELAVTGSIPQDPKGQTAAGRWWWWYRPWYEHQNLRDERAEAFASLLWEGVYNYSYVCRATTPGTFVVPPPKAEEMYHPETFGRGATDRVIVE
jgi:uncharacterized protein YfaS (alpha-2-macroglobulin family)